MVRRRTCRSLKDRGRKVRKAFLRAGGEKKTRGKEGNAPSRIWFGECTRFHVDSGTRTVGVKTSNLGKEWTVSKLKKASKQPDRAQREEDVKLLPTRTSFSSSLTSSSKPSVSLLRSSSSTDKVRFRGPTCDERRERECAAAAAREGWAKMDAR
jgi:hypothetical protein